MLTEKIHVAVPTAFNVNEDLDVTGTLNHVRNLSSQGVRSVLISGSTGEQHSVSLEEKLSLISALKNEEELLNKMEIIFGVSAIRQKEAEELVKMINLTNISGIMLGFPPYLIPTQTEALIYADRLIKMSNKPVIIYNNPKRTGFDLSSESMIKLCEHKLVIGLKDPGSKEKIKKINQAVNVKTLYIYAGGEINLKEKLTSGYNRLSSIAGNVYPTEISVWFNKIIDEEKLSEKEAIIIKRIIEDIYNGSPLVNLKKLINNQGTAIGICRRPLGNSI